MFLNHFCLRKEHTKRRCSQIVRKEYVCLRRRNESDIFSHTLRHGRDRTAAVNQRGRKHLTERSHEAMCVEMCPKKKNSFSSCVNTTTEGDLNMHSSKGFYTTILVSEESHPFTALQPVVVPVYTLHGVCLNPGAQAQTTAITSGQKSPRRSPGFQRWLKHKTQMIIKDYTSKCKQKLELRSSLEERL